MVRIPKSVTIGDKYGPAMEIKNQDEADEYFEACVQSTMEHWGKTREEAEKIEKGNLGYYAGYYDHDTRIRVERLFKCRHPIFGSAAAGAPTPEAAFAAGESMGNEPTSEKGS